MNDGHDASPGHRAGLPNPLPTELCFVVQFWAGAEASAEATGEIAAGRVEHVVSGRQRRFANAAQLVDALRELMTAVVTGPRP